MARDVFILDVSHHHSIPRRRPNRDQVVKLVLVSSSDFLIFQRLRTTGQEPGVRVYDTAFPNESFESDAAIRFAHCPGRM